MRQQIAIAALAATLMIGGVVAIVLGHSLRNHGDESDARPTTTRTTESERESVPAFSRMSDESVCEPVIEKAAEFGTTDSVEMGAVAGEFKGCGFGAEIESSKYAFTIAATDSIDPLCSIGTAENKKVKIRDVDVCLNHNDTGELYIDGDKWKGNTMKSDFAVDGITVEVVSRTDKPYTLDDWPWKKFHDAIVGSAIEMVERAL